MRHFIFTSLLAITAIAHAADRKPNFIFVIADDHRWDAMGSVQKEHGDNARYPWFETPSMDRLAAEGVRFRNAFINQGIYQNRPFNINGTVTPTQGWVDDVSTNFAIDWLKQNGSPPFSLVLGFKSPHNKRGGENLPERLRHLYEVKTTKPTPNCDKNK